MKITSFVFACLLTSLANALPYSTADEDDDEPLPQTSRITAFIVDDKGNPAIECWEISQITNYMHVQRADGSKATAHSVSIAASKELDGVDVFTWPPYVPIWPPRSGDIRTTQFDLSDAFSLFNVQTGLINVGYLGDLINNAADETRNYIFAPDNGDDWFYFEDNYSSSDIGKGVATQSGLGMGSVSSTETELLRLKYKQTPTHKVLYKGACKFTGIRTASENSNQAKGMSRAHSPLTVQVRIEEDL